MERLREMQDELTKEYASERAEEVENPLCVDAVALRAIRSKIDIQYK